MSLFHRVSIHVGRIGTRNRRSAVSLHMNVFSCGGGVDARSLLVALLCGRLFLLSLLRSTRVYFEALTQFVLLICVLSVLGCNEGSAVRKILPTVEQQEPKGSYLLIPDRSCMNMGEVAQGGCKVEPFKLRNPGKQTVELARIETSCDCLTVDVPSRVLSGEQVECRAKLDLSHEPKFMSDLMIEIRGWTSAGEAAFLVVAAVRVPATAGR